LSLNVFSLRTGEKISHNDPTNIPAALASQVQRTPMMAASTQPTSAPMGEAPSPTKSRLAKGFTA
jgi:hypothetical protein